MWPAESEKVEAEGELPEARMEATAGLEGNKAERSLRTSVQLEVMPL